MEVKLNLIPKYRKDEIAKAKLLKLILQWEMGISFVSAIFFGLLLSLNYILQFNLYAQTSELNSGQSKEKYEKIAVMDSNFKGANMIVSTDESIQKDQLYWSILFQKMNDRMPDGISVSKLANKNYKILVAGVSDTRDILISMRDNFSQEDCFSDVSLPLSNLVSKDNIAFQIEFNVKESCIKK